MLRGGVSLIRPVLVVEDDDAIRRMLIAALAEEAGFAFAAARDGIEALERARALKPGVVVLDMKLPRMDGYAVAEQLKADPATADCWVIGISAAGQPDRAIAAGCDQFLWKPLRLDELLIAVEAGLLRAKEVASG